MGRNSQNSPREFLGWEGVSFVIWRRRRFEERERGCATFQVQLVGLLGAGTGSQDGGLEIHSVACILCVHDSFLGSQYMVFNILILSDFAYGLLPG